MALSINPQDLVAKQFFAKSPDSKAQLLNSLRGSLQKGRLQNEADDKNALFAKGAESAFNGEQSASQAAELFAADPQRAQALVQSAGVFTENGRKQLTRKVSEIMAIQNPEQRNMALKGVADTMVAAGDDPSAFSSLIGQDYGQQTSALQAMQMATLSVQERLGQSNTEKSFSEQQRVNDSNIANQQNAMFNRNQNTALAAKKNQQLQLKAEMAALEGVTLGAKERRSINGDVTALIKPTAASYAAARSLSSLAETASPTDQLAAIFQFMKSLDPTSVVREGEQAMARSTGGPADAMIGFFNQAKGVGGLTPSAFRNMVNTARGIANSSIESSELQVGDYLRTFENTIPEKFIARLIERVPTPFNDLGSLKKDNTGGEKGGVLQIDANGNKAMVFPDGTFKEVK